MVERQGGSVSPEPETTLDKAAWQLAHREYLIVEWTDSGFRYELLTKQFESTIQGQVDRPGWTMNQATELCQEGLGKLPNKHMRTESRNGRAGCPRALLAS